MRKFLYRMGCRLEAYGKRLKFFASRPDDSPYWAWVHSELAKQKELT